MIPSPTSEGPRAGVGHIAAPRPDWTIAVLLLSDVASLSLAVLMAGLATRYALPTTTPLELGHAFLMLLAPVGFAFAGLYPATALGPIDEFRKIGRVILLVGIGGTVALSLLTALPATLPLLLSSVLAVLTVPVGRAALREIVAHRNWWGEPVVILGAGATARLVVEQLRKHPRMGMKAIAFLDDAPGMVGRSVSGLPVAGALSAVDSFVRSGVCTAVIAMPGVPPRELVRLVEQHTDGFRDMVVVPNLFGLRTLGVETRDLGGVLGLHVRHNLIDPVNRVAKRLLDIALVLPTLLIGLPLMLVSALAIVVVSPGNPFFFQERIGLDGRPIRVWKLRTMHLDATERLEEHLERDPVASAEWTLHYKLADDPRILPVVGPVLRKSSIDEIPQILNVLRGEMSFIGPRPFPQYHLTAFPDEFQVFRSKVRPGITGLWQVSARSDGDLAVQQEIDTYYIRNWSIWMDLYILARTPLAVLTARGAR